MAQIASPSVMTYSALSTELALSMRQPGGSEGTYSIYTVAANVPLASLQELSAPKGLA